LARRSASTALASLDRMSCATISSTFLGPSSTRRSCLRTRCL
jgi:hypothetical protein